MVLKNKCFIFYSFIYIYIYISVTHSLTYIYILGKNLFRDTSHDVIVKWAEIFQSCQVSNSARCLQVDQNKTSEINIIMLNFGNFCHYSLRVGMFYIQFVQNQ